MRKALHPLLNHSSSAEKERRLLCSLGPRRFAHADQWTAVGGGAECQTTVSTGELQSAVSSEFFDDSLAVQGRSDIRERTDAVLDQQVCSIELPSCGGLLTLDDVIHNHAETLRWIDGTMTQSISDKDKRKEGRAVLVMELLEIESQRRLVSNSHQYKATKRGRNDQPL